jgi:hypothetical protein
MPSVLIGVDADGTVVQWNREAEQRYGTLDKACWSWSFWQIRWQIRRAFGS